MKTFKKILVNILMCFMLISSFGVSVIAEEENLIETSQEEVVVEENLEQTLDEVLEAEDPLQGSEEVDIPDEYLQKVTNIATNFAWAMSGGGNFLFGACLSGGIAGIFDVTVNLLKNVIVFGEDADEQFRQQLMDKLNAIDAQIGDVNAKVDSMQDSINAAVKLVDEKMSEISIKLDKQNITNIAIVADSLRNEMKNYDATLTSQIHTWYDNKNIINYLTGDYYVVKGSYPDPDSTEENPKENLITNILVDWDIMYNAIYDYTIAHIDEGWDPDKKDEIAKAIFKDVGEKIATAEIENDEFVEWIKNNPSFGEYTSWNDYSDLAKENILTCFADMAYGTLCEIAAKNIAKASSSGAETYASKLINQFNLYCNYLTKKDDKYVSPMESYYNMYSSLFAFQGDLKRDLSFEDRDEDGNVKKDDEGNIIYQTEHSDLLDIARQKYISELNEIGSFVGLMAKASGNYGEKSDMRSLVYIPWAAAEKSLNDDYVGIDKDGKYNHKGYYKVTDNGEPIDNYCYITKSILEYKTGHVKADMDMKFYAWENGFGTDIKSYRDTYMVNDWTYSINNADMVDSLSLGLINAHMTGVYGNASLVEYLKAMGINVDEDLPTTVITKFIGGRDFTSEDKVNMFIKNCHNNPDKWSGKDYARGDTTTVTSSSSHFKIRRKGVSDVFDLATGIATNSKRIGAVASFYEKYTFKDDLVVFWDAEYNNPQDKDALIELAKKHDFYWRERYDTKSDDEERYKSHVNYDALYGTIVTKNDVSEVIDNNVINSGLSLKSILPDQDDAFISALKEKGYSIEDYKDYLYDDTYEIYFDETRYNGEAENGEYNGVVSKDVYSKLLDYLTDKDNIDRMVNDYYSMNDKINKIINHENNQIVIDTDIVDQIVKASIEKDLQCEVMNRVPVRNRDRNVYNYQTGKLYVWKNYKYKEYDIENEIKIKRKYKHYNVNEDNYIDEPLVGVYPYKNSTDVQFKYQINSFLAYELYFDSNGNVNYVIHPIYDIYPIVTYKNDGKEYSFKVSNEVLEQLNVGRIEIMVPVIYMNDKDNRAVVNHYHDLDQLEQPIEQFTGVIYDKSYTLIKVDKFSPFYIDNTYKYSYVAPVTGD